MIKILDSAPARKADRPRFPFPQPPFVLYCASKRPALAVLIRRRDASSLEITHARRASAHVYFAKLSACNAYLFVYCLSLFSISADSTRTHILIRGDCGKAIFSNARNLIVFMPLGIRLIGSRNKVSGVLFALVMARL